VADADVELDLPAASLQCFPILRDLLSRATELSAGGSVLIPPALPEIVALRNWICNEVARQSAGLAPTPWIEGETDKVESAPIDAVTLDAIRGSDLALVAADASNRIVAVSGAAAELLGWAAGDLEGRRLVVLIPPRLRNRHVAGFTRNLLDGSTRIIGEDVVVPALRRDGSEFAVSLRIERLADPATWALYVATLSPVG
jgi:PAS domain S-box-containing protein